MYAGRITCCPLVSHGEYADGTDGRTPNCCIMHTNTAYCWHQQHANTYAELEMEKKDEDGIKHNNISVGMR